MHKLHPAHDAHRAVKKGDFVTLHYVGRLADGTIFESTDKKPLRVVVGEHATIHGIEEGIIGMKSGEKKRIVVSPDKAYGKYHKDIIEELPLSKIPPEITPSVGMVLTQESKSGRTLFMRITKVNRDSVIVDMNHPLAGKTLVFDVVVMDIQ
jgi:FKBP-type peptidyl-prolyl cis-trans isomerase 2